MAALQQGRKVSQYRAALQQGRKVSQYRAAKGIILLAVLASAGMALPPSLGVGVYQLNTGSDGTGDSDYGDYYAGDTAGDTVPIGPSEATTVRGQFDTSVFPSISVSASPSPSIADSNIEAFDNSRMFFSGTNFTLGPSAMTDPPTSGLGLQKQPDPPVTLELTATTWPNSPNPPSRSHTLITTSQFLAYGKSTWSHAISRAKSSSLPSTTETLFTTSPDAQFRDPSSSFTPETSHHGISSEITEFPSSKPPLPSHLTISSSVLRSGPKIVTSSPKYPGQLSVTSDSSTGIMTTPPETKTQQSVSKTTSSDTKTTATSAEITPRDTNPPPFGMGQADETISPPAEFYLGLCWQNDIIVDAAFTEHYWQAIAVLFLAVLINVLVMYGLVFRAVHRQSRRWGNQGRPPAGLSKGPPTPLSKPGHVQTNQGRPPAGLSKGPSTPLSKPGHVQTNGHRARPQRRNSMSGNGRDSGVESLPQACQHTVCSEAGNAMTKLEGAQGKHPEHENGKELRTSFKTVQRNFQNGEKWARSMTTAAAVAATRTDGINSINNSNYNYDVDTKPQESSKTVQRNFWNVEKGTRTVARTGGKNINNSGAVCNDEDEITSLDDGHYNDWAAKSSILPVGPPIAHLDKTSFFCTGSCTVGRTKYYRSRSCGDSTYLNAGEVMKWQREEEELSVVSVVNGLTKTRRVSSETEPLYRRPSWFRRKLVKALSHTGWHQRHRKVHETAVFKLARRQRAKVRMLNKEHNSWLAGENISGDLSTASDDGSGKDSLCNQLEMESIQEEQTLQAQSQPTPDETRENSSKPNETAAPFSSVKFVTSPFPYTGEELQSQINSVASNPVNIFSTTKQFTKQTKFDNRRESSSIRIFPEGEVFSFPSQGAFEQTDKGPWSLQEKKPHIWSPFAPATAPPEPSTLAFMGLSLPNTPEPSLDYKKEKQIKTQGMSIQGEKSSPSPSIFNPTVLPQNARPQSASAIPNPERPQIQPSTTMTRRQSESRIFLKPNWDKLPKQHNLQFQYTLNTEKGIKTSLDHTKNKTGAQHLPQTLSHQQKQIENLVPRPKVTPDTLAAVPPAESAAAAAAVPKTSAASAVPKASAATMGHRRRYSTAQVKTAKVLLLVTAVYLVSFAPALLMTLNLVPPQRIIFYAYFVHSAANPLIYSFINQTFRKQLAALLSLKTRT
ncbi:hypothetical protein EGW08_016575 [Elysia chlorotica]|uniref:G-protein coupled receptors family 1 profile domain-containing protein n=1 Tax=Elysia chlorotica TaxID=188477 RepID=A0A433T266_ELYCH|nr:hypothetical protein EGW08_016575 [Elysia chlorotica]